MQRFNGHMHVFLCLTFTRATHELARFACSEVKTSGPSRESSTLKFARVSPRGRTLMRHEAALAQREPNNVTTLRMCTLQLTNDLILDMFLHGVLQCFHSTSRWRRAHPNTCMNAPLSRRCDNTRLAQAFLLPSGRCDRFVRKTSQRVATVRIY